MCLAIRILSGADSTNRCPLPRADRPSRSCATSLICDTLGGRCAGHCVQAAADTHPRVERERQDNGALLSPNPNSTTFKPQPALSPQQPGALNPVYAGSRQHSVLNPQKPPAQKAPASARPQTQNRILGTFMPQPATFNAPPIGPSVIFSARVFSWRTACFCLLWVETLVSSLHARFAVRIRQLWTGKEPALTISVSPNRLRWRQAASLLRQFQSRSIQCCAGPI